MTVKATFQAPRLIVVQAENGGGRFRGRQGSRPVGETGGAKTITRGRSTGFLASCGYQAETWQAIPAIAKRLLSISIALMIPWQSHIERTRWLAGTFVKKSSRRYGELRSPLWPRLTLETHGLVDFSGQNSRNVIFEPPQCRIAQVPRMRASKEGVRGKAPQLCRLDRAAKRDGGPKCWLLKGIRESNRPREGPNGFT